jgi:pimeloyl-ACP methyl ester carboxylesterase
MITINKSIKKILFCCSLAFCCNITFAQNKLTAENIPQLNTQLFCLTTATDTIYFIKYDTINERKPLFIFITSSLPIPLIIDYGKAYNIAMATNFYHLLDNQIFENFNVVEISQPNIPPIILYEDLDSRGAYKNHSHLFKERNVSETYVERSNEVINCLLKQEWIDSDSIYIFGHSQGAYIAARVAAANEAVTAIAFASTNPFGRYAGVMMEEARVKAIKGQMTEEEAQKKIEHYWNQWNYMIQMPTVPDDWMQLPTTWKSFSQSVVDILANLKQPVFVAYGTRDYHSLACELLPIYFGFSGKTNYKMHPMLGRGHNFELIDDEGKPNWDDMKWSEVTVEFMKFVKAVK